MTRNTSQDPEYEGLPYHEKKFHKTHFGVLTNGLKKREDGDTKKFGDVLYIWKNGKWYLPSDFDSDGRLYENTLEFELGQQGGENPYKKNSVCWKRWQKGYESIKGK